MHRWKTEKDTLFTKYQRCAICNKKRIIQGSGGYQPVDRDYLKKD